MDNLTHSLVGLAASKAGLERLSPAATTICIIAANAPDADILATFGGRWSYLQHHRGITHSIVGTIALAIMIPTIFWLIEYLFARIRGRPNHLRLRGLLIASLIVSATHPLLDWTNNYGIRPFLPWNSRWYYGDLVFIIDPWLWLGLGGACFLLKAKSIWTTGAWSILALILSLAIVLVPTLRPGSNFPVAAQVVWIVGIVGIVAAHRLHLADRWGRLIPLVVFGLIIAYWGGLAILHRQVMSRAGVLAQAESGTRGESIKRLATMPVLANPMRWQCVFETDRATYRFDYVLGKGKTGLETLRYERPKGTDRAAYETATQDGRAKIFLGFARFPVARIEGDCVSETLVQFADLRYTEPGRGARGAFSLEVPVECPGSSSQLETK